MRTIADSPSAIEAPYNLTSASVVKEVSDASHFENLHDANILVTLFSFDRKYKNFRSESQSSTFKNNMEESTFIYSSFKIGNIGEFVLSFLDPRRTSFFVSP